MSIVAIMGPLTIVSQIIQIYDTKNVAGVSQATWIFSIITSTIWLVYSFHHKDKPVIFNSLICGIFCLFITFGIYLYR